MHKAKKIALPGRQDPALLIHKVNNFQSRLLHDFAMHGKLNATDRGVILQAVRERKSVQPSSGEF